MRQVAMTTVALVVASVSQLLGQEVAVRGLGGYGFTDGYDLGAGGSLGVSIPLGTRNVYLGARLVHHFGGTVEVVARGGTSEKKVHVLLFGGEVAIGWLANPVILQTTGYVGIGKVTAEATRGDISSTSNTNGLLLSPGVIVGLPLGRSFVGIEARYLFLDDVAARLRLDDIDRGFALYATVGTTLSW